MFFRIASQRQKRQNKSTLGGPMSEKDPTNQFFESLLASIFRFVHGMAKTRLVLTGNLIQWFLTLKNLPVFDHFSIFLHVFQNRPQSNFLN